MKVICRSPCSASMVQRLSALDQRAASFLPLSRYLIENEIAGLLIVTAGPVPESALATEL